MEPNESDQNATPSGEAMELLTSAARWALLGSRSDSANIPGASPDRRRFAPMPVGLGVFGEADEGSRLPGSMAGTTSEQAESESSSSPSTRWWMGGADEHSARV